MGGEHLPQATKARMISTLTKTARLLRSTLGLGGGVSSATLAKMMTQKETLLPALSTHIATHTRAYSQFEELFPV